MQGDEAAKAELQDLKIKWNKIIQNIEENRITPQEERRYILSFHNEKDGMFYRYGNNLNSGTLNEIAYTFSEISTDLNLALKKGRQNYEDEIFNRKKELLHENMPIITIIIAIILVILVNLLFGITIPISI